MKHKTTRSLYEMLQELETLLLESAKLAQEMNMELKATYTLQKEEK